MEGNVDYNEIFKCRTLSTSSNTVGCRANNRTADLLSFDASSLTDRMNLFEYLASQSDPLARHLD